ncbi:MAG: NUDIX hydrolase [Pacificimonas sp.]
MTSAKPFSGAKIALINGDDILCYVRDDKPGIPWRGYWDLPGGGREGDETPQQCVLREVEEEFALSLTPDIIGYARAYPSVEHEGMESWFFAALLQDHDIERIKFGSEGQYWRMRPTGDFIRDESSVPYLTDRLSEYLTSGSR